jgi:hypothetical protein
MRFVVIDVQGFCIPDLQVKELAIYDGKNMKSYVFKPTIPFHALSEDCQKQVKFVYCNHHGINYNFGDRNFEEIYSILFQELRDVDTIYVKGDAKRSFLLKLFSEMKFNPPYIVNLEFCNGNVPKLGKNYTSCSYHNLTICACSVKNALVLYNYIVSLLPQ